MEIQIIYRIFEASLMEYIFIKLLLIFYKAKKLILNEKVELKCV